MSSPSANTECIIVFLRSPDWGRVKTRLAESIGRQTANDLYRCFVSDLLSTLAETGFPVRLCFTPLDAAAGIAAWLGGGYPMFPQKGADLGSRMSNAFHRVFEEGVSRALLVGTDVPDLPGERIVSGFAALNAWPAVLTPTPDGGYCLVGFRADTFDEEVFSGHPWGTDRVLQSTLSAFERVRCAPRLLESWPDIDTVEDLAAFWKRTGDTPVEAKRTAAFLAARFPDGLPRDGPRKGAKFD